MVTNEGANRVKTGAVMLTAMAVLTLTAGAPVAPVMPAAAAGGAVVQVRTVNFAFSPASIKVAPGTTVAWRNADQVPHTSTSRDGVWDSKMLQPGTAFSVTFEKAGTYVYGCTIHPFMQATVVVGN